jgi:c(7)-type cytochrome triheme protein
MCGRSLTFRESDGSNRGSAPAWGVAPENGGAEERWGIAATAHQTAEPQGGPRRKSSLRRLSCTLIIVFTTAIFADVIDTFAPASSANREASLLYPPVPQDQNIDFSKFRHDNTSHARLPCLLCHRRETNSAKPTLPGGGGHLPCTGCHAKEFTNSSSPVCTICHTDTQSGMLKAFPPLRSFSVKFDHATHTRGAGVNCSTCHRPLRSGQALSIPAGSNAHTTCYQCHAPQAQANGRDISSCSTCHQPGRYSRTSTQAAAFKVGFGHAKHAAQKLNCTACHSVRAGMPQRKQVTTPLPLNHHAPAGTTSCATCHNGKRAFGGDDFSACTKCHRGPQWRF